MKFATAFVGLGLAAAMNLPAWSQANPKPDQKPDQKPEPTSSRMPAAVKTIFLTNAAPPNDGNEILTAIRLIDPPDTKLYWALDQNAITIAGTPDEIALAERLIHELDRPRKAYRLAYTFTESDGGKRIGVSHSAVVVVVGGRTTLKNGSKVPVATGSFNTTGASAQTQFTYLDVGLNIDASLDALGDGVRLKSKIEQSSALEEKTIAGVNEPVVRQSVIEGTAFLIVGKPVILGTLDVSGSTRQLEIEVLLKPVD